MAKKIYSTKLDANVIQVDVRYGGATKYTRYAVDYLGIWERVNNPGFNITEFSNIRNQAGTNGYVLTCKQWIDRSNARGIISTAGRYGGTFAHFNDRPLAVDKIGYTSELDNYSSFLRC